MFIVQIIAAVGLPVNLELEAVTIGFSFKCNYILPSNASDYWGVLSDPFDVTSHPIHRRSVKESEETASSGYDYQQHEKFERHSVDAGVVESGTIKNHIENKEPVNDFASTRWLVYKGLAEIAEK